MAGKGDKPRPMNVDRKTYEDNYDRIFNKNKQSDEYRRREQALDELTQLAQEMGGYDNPLQKNI
jgi:hypothetical protein